MTLPEKVRDVTQSEWLEVRERLAAAEAACEGSDRYQELLREHVRHIDDSDKAAAMYAERSERFSQQADQLASQLALAMAWGAEVCERTSFAEACSTLDAVEKGAWRERAERAEAERDAAEHRAESLYTGAKRWNEAMAELAEARIEAQRGRTSVAAVNAALRDYPDADVSALWVPASEALEYQACWHRDVAKGRAAIEKRDEARERAQVAECEVQSWKDECGRWEERVGEVEARLIAVTAERDAMRKERDEALALFNEAEREKSDAWGHKHAADIKRERAEADLAAARAQLAAVVAAATSINHCIYYSDTYQQWVLAYPDRTRPALDALRSAISDTAQAAREHDERVRAEERAKAIDEVLRCVEEPTGADRPYQARNIIAERIRALGSRS